MYDNRFSLGTVFRCQNLTQDGPLHHQNVCIFYWHVCIPAPETPTGLKLTSFDTSSFFITWVPQLCEYTSLQVYVDEINHVTYNILSGDSSTVTGLPPASIYTFRVSSVFDGISNYSKWKDCQFTHELLAFLFFIQLEVT